MELERGASLTELVVAHRELLSLIDSSGPLSSRQIEQRLDCSRATVNRHLASLREEGVVQRDDGDYSLSRFGITTLATVEDAVRRITITSEFPELVARIEDCPVELDVAALADATVTRATSEDPYEIHERYLELWNDATRMRAIRGFGAVPPDIVEHIKPKLQANFDAESVWNAVAAEQYFEKYPEVTDLVGEESKTPLLITDEPIPVELGLFDHRLSIIVHDDETGFPQALVDTANIDAMAWADAVYEYYRERARPVEL